MYSNNKLSKAVRLALAFTAASTAVFATSVSAQEEEATAKVERIEVTGSRIKRSDMESASPVLVMDRAQIDASGMVSIGDILQQIPAAGAALNTAFNNGGNGSTNMDLRNLGAQRLLVLVNGRRWISSLGSTVDLNTIPTSAIERVEVMKDGASAIYGSDAIAGVVNIITRKDFEGVEVSVYAGENASKSDGRQYTADLTLGYTTQKGGILFNMSHVTQQPIWAGDRAISSYGSSANADNTRIRVSDVSLNAANQAALAAAYTGTPNNNTGAINYDLMSLEGTGSNLGLDKFRNRTGSDVYNYAPDNYLVTPQNRNAFYFQGYYDLSDNLRFVSDFVLTNRKSDQELAPMPVSLGEANGYAGSLVDIHADNIYNPFGETLYGSAARAQANGHGSDYVAYNLARRMVEAGSRNFSQNDTTYRAMVGFEGNIGDTSWTWDAHYIYGENSQTEYTKGLLNMSRIGNALGANCSAATNCVPLNLFGGPGSITQDMLKYITFDSVSRSGLTLKDYAFNTGGDLFELPGGVVGLAIGLERREESGFDTPDPITAAGESSGNQRDATSGKFRLDEAYVELSIPVFERLLISPAVRFSDHSAYGSDSTAKVGLEFRPIDDLLVRATWAEGYRAPSISDLYAGNADSYPSWTDPCNGGAAANNGVGDNPNRPGCASVPDSYTQSNTQIRITQVSSPDLKPETSESYTAGLVYNPSWLDGAEFTLDYYSVKVNDAISRYGHTRIARECSESSTAAACAFIDRDTNGNIVDLRNFLTNIGEYEVEGVDFYTAYRFNSNYGLFKASLDLSYIITNKSSGQEQTGIQWGDAGYPRIKGNLQFDWALDDWDAHWKVRYVHSMKNYYHAFYGETWEDGTMPETGGYVVHNVSVGYNLDAYNTKLTLGVNNLFAKEPKPEGWNNNYSASTNNFSVTEYDVNMDRFVYLRATVKF